ncbi:MAG: hypothetical protein V3U79_11575 [Dehalococcoidia bacterium]
MTRCREVGIFLTAGLILLLIGASCGGGLSDATKTATATVPTATAEVRVTPTAQAEATAQPQPTATPTAQAEATPSPEVQHWLDVYDSLPDDVKARIEAIPGISIGRNQFVEAVSWLDEGGPTESQMQSLVRLFEAIGDLEVTFLSTDLWAGAVILSAAAYQTAGMDIDETTLNAIRAGTAFPTGTQAAVVFDITAQFMAMGEWEELPEPDIEDFMSFLEGLPAGVRGEMEDAGWAEERINTILFEQEVMSIEEIRSLFEPLSNIPIPTFAPFITGVLNHIPSVLLGPFVQEIGQEAYDELKAGVRGPTGGEFLTFFQMLETLGLGEFEEGDVEELVPTPVPVTVRTIAGEWTASTEFGQFAFTVAPDGASISEFDFDFSEYACGSVTVSGGVNVSVQDPSLWPVTNGQFDREFEMRIPPLEMLIIRGEFDEAAMLASGTWEVFVTGSVSCAGTWQSSR